MLPTEPVLVAAALGVNPVAPTAELLVFQPPVHVPIGRLFAPEVRFAGSVNVSATPVAAALVTSKRPAPASVIATVLFTPGVTLPKARLFPLATVMAESTVAVALIEPLCACSEAAPRLKVTAVKAENSVAVRIASLPDR